MRAIPEIFDPSDNYVVKTDEREHSFRNVSVPVSAARWARDSYWRIGLRDRYRRAGHLRANVVGDRLARDRGRKRHHDWARPIHEGGSGSGQSGRRAGIENDVRAPYDKSRCVVAADALDGLRPKLCEPYDAARRQRACDR